MPIDLRHGSLPPITGIVDDVTDDGSTIWVISVPHGRKMIHVQDGYEVAILN